MVLKKSEVFFRILVRKNIKKCFFFKLRILPRRSFFSEILSFFWDLKIFHFKKWLHELKLEKLCSIDEYQFLKLDFFLCILDNTREKMKDNKWFFLYILIFYIFFHHCSFYLRDRNEKIQILAKTIWKKM